MHNTGSYGLRYALPLLCSLPGHRRLTKGNIWVAAADSLMLGSNVKERLIIMIMPDLLNLTSSQAYNFKSSAVGLRLGLPRPGQVESEER